MTLQTIEKGQHTNGYPIERFFPEGFQEFSEESQEQEDMDMVGKTQKRKDTDELLRTPKLFKEVASLSPSMKRKKDEQEEELQILLLATQKVFDEIKSVCSSIANRIDDAVNELSGDRNA